MVDWTVLETTADYKKTIRPEVAKLIDSIEMIAKTYVELYTGPGGEEEAALNTIIALTRKLRSEVGGTAR